MAICVHSSSILTAASMLMLVGTAHADWTNAGGNAGRNGLTDAVGPDAADLLWSGGPSSVIAWQPVIEGQRVFIVRQTGFPPEPNSDKSPIFSIDLDTGAQLWKKNLPFNSGEWTTFIGGVRDGRVFAGRSGNGASSKAKLHALDAATGNTLWLSADLIDAGFYDGFVFADDGDPVIASFQKIWRIDASTGATVWSANRVGSVSGTCGGAIHNGAIYVADAVAGGNAIKKFDLSTGALVATGPVMPGFTIQNTPMVGPDGTIYLSRTQNNAAVDFFYAFVDNGPTLAQKWSVPAAWTTNSEFGVGPDGSIYMMGVVGTDKVLQRRSAVDGSLLSSTGPIAADFLSPRIAIDANGRVYFSNGAFSNGRVWSFNADLTERWTVPVTNINIGGPAIAADGTMIVAGVGTDLRAYRSASCYADCDADGTLTIDDFICFQTLFALGDPASDCDESGILNINDFICFQTLFALGC
jgi:PQQ-like domain